MQNVLDDVQAGKPQTILVLGSDKRFNEKAGPGAARSDTMMLIRLDPEKNATAVMSIPRDLKATIPGHGVDKINAAYSIGGPKLAVTTVRSLLNIPINHVVNVNFGGFSRAVKRLGCFYIDVDRRYFNDNNPPAGGGGERYATIDIEPGYQRLCGLDSLDYVRFRHLDDDFVRAARQQSYLEQAKLQVGVGRLFSDREELLRIFGRYTQTRHQLRGRDPPAPAADLRGHEVPDPRGPLPGRDRERRQRLVRDDHRRQPAEDRPPVPRGARVLRRGSAQADDDDPEDLGHEPSSSKKKSSKRRAPGRARARARRRPRRRARTSSRRCRRRRASCRSTTPPSARTHGYADQSSNPRLYTIKDRAGYAYKAYRIVGYAGENGQYWGVQGTNWRSPPILDDPSGTIRMRGRTYHEYYDGTRLRLIAWRTDRGVYWVSNTLSRTLTNSQMRDIAKSLTRVGT